MHAALDIDDRDSGCEATGEALERYVEAELLGREPGKWGSRPPRRYLAFRAAADREKRPPATYQRRYA